MSRRAKRRDRQQQRSARKGRHLDSGLSMPQVSPSLLGVIGLMAMTAMAAATIIVMALYWVANDPVAGSLLAEAGQGLPPVSATAEAGDGDRSSERDGGSTPACTAGPRDSVTQVEVSARPVAPFTTDVTAWVTINGDPLTDAAPAATADMLEMPCAHTIPLVPLQAVVGEPGLYQGQVQVVMVGTWEFIVQLQGGITGEGSATIPVTTVRPQ